MTAVILPFARTDDALKELDIRLWFDYAEKLRAAGMRDAADEAMECVHFRVRHRSRAQRERIQAGGRGAR